jgi:hypothetical protein
VNRIEGCIAQSSFLIACEQHVRFARNTSRCAINVTTKHENGPAVALDKDKVSGLGDKGEQDGSLTNKRIACAI